MSRRLTIALVVLATAAASLAQRDFSTMPVEAKLQAAILAKVFVYDRTLVGREELKVVLVYAGTKKADYLQELHSGFADSGIASETVTESELDSALEGASKDAAAAYISPGVDAEVAAAICQEHGVLTITGLPRLVERGKVSVGIGVRAGRPSILVHLPHAVSEGHDLSADLLKLAKIYR